MVLLRNALARQGDVQAGLAKVDAGLSLLEQSGEWYWHAELHRTKGWLLLVGVEADEGGAEACFRQAIEIARSQEAKSWELRAATSLAELWRGQGKCHEAYDLLAPVFGWFTEGFETSDLRKAKLLLDELS